MRRFLSWLLDDRTPHRSEVRDRFLTLPELPEAERMTHGPKATRKPRSFEEWQQKHGRKTA